MGAGLTTPLVWSAYYKTKAHFLENELYSHEKKIIILDITVGKLNNIAGSKSKLLKRFLEQQAGVSLVLQEETLHTNKQGRCKKVEKQQFSRSVQIQNKHQTLQSKCEQKFNFCPISY